MYLKQWCGPLCKLGWSFSQPLSHSVTFYWQSDHDCLFVVKENMDILKHLILLHTFTPPPRPNLSSHVFNSLCRGTHFFPPFSSPRLKQYWLSFKANDEKRYLSAYLWHFFFFFSCSLSFSFIHMIWEFTILLTTASCELKLNLEC